MLVARCQLRAPSPLVVKRKAKAWKFVGEFLWRRSFQKDEAAFAKWTKNQLIDLGPTYTKLGQAASTRSDLFPNTINLGGRAHHATRRCPRRENGCTVALIDAKLLMHRREAFCERFDRSSVQGTPERWY